MTDNIFFYCLYYHYKQVRVLIVKDKITGSWVFINWKFNCGLGTDPCGIPFVVVIFFSGNMVKKAGRQIHIRRVLSKWFGFDNIFWNGLNGFILEIQDFEKLIENIFPIYGLKLT